VDKGALLAIIGSVSVFLIVLVFMFYSHSDFDQQLIDQVDKGVPAEKLLPQIDKETEKLIENAQRRYSKVVNKNFENGNIASKNDYESYTEVYEKEMRMISEYDVACKKFARREISKEQFLQEIRIPKEMEKLVS
jgi:hypothetical protein